MAAVVSLAEASQNIYECPGNCGKTGFVTTTDAKKHISTCSSIV